MSYNYVKYSKLPESVQAIQRNKARSEELDNDAERRTRFNTDKENCDKVKMLLTEGYNIKNYISEGTKCIFELEKNTLTEKIELRFTNNINEIKKLLNISE